MGVVEQARKLTEAEYLARERAAQFKSEFFDGEMFAMAGGSPMHSLIATHLAAEFTTQLRGRPSMAFSSNLPLARVFANVKFVPGPIRPPTPPRA